MNLSRAWNVKLGAGIFWLSKNLYKQCELDSANLRSFLCMVFLTDLSLIKMVFKKISQSELSKSCLFIRCFFVKNN